MEKPNLLRDYTLYMRNTRYRSLTEHFISYPSSKVIFNMEFSVESLNSNKTKNPDNICQWSIGHLRTINYLIDQVHKQSLLANEAGSQ